MKKPMLLLFTVGMTLCGFAQEIKFETTEHDFGIVDYNAPAVYDFVFTNTGTEPLIVQKPKTSCACALPSWPKDPIMPGKQDKVSVTYNTNKVGKFNRYVTVTSNAINSPTIVLKIRGEVLHGGAGVKIVYRNGYYGIESDEGRIVIPVEYEMIKKSNYSSNLQLKKNGKWGTADKTGHIFIPCEYDEEFDLDADGWVKKGGKWGIIDKENRVIIPFDYEYASLSIKTAKRNGIVKKGGKWGKIDVENNKVIIPFEYEMLSEFVGNSMLVKKNGKFGAFDASGKTIILPFEYNTEEELIEALQKKLSGK